MDINAAKHLWQEHISRSSKTQEQPVIEVIENKMWQLGKEARKRTIIGGLTFAILLVAMGIFSIFLYLTKAPILTVLGVVSWQVSIVITIGVLFRMKGGADRADYQASMGTVLKAHLSRVQAESQFYRTIVWWLLAPMGIGFVMILIGTNASLMISAVELTFFLLCCFSAHRHNKRHIEKKLKPIEEELATSLAGL